MEILPQKNKKRDKHEKDNNELFQQKETIEMPIEMQMEMSFKVYNNIYLKKYSNFQLIKLFFFHK